MSGEVKEYVSSSLRAHVGMMEASMKDVGLGEDWARKGDK